MPTLHATPFDLSHTGFYFDTPEQFEAVMLRAPFEEVELQFIDGTPHAAVLFRLFQPHQGNIADYYTALDAEYEDHQLAALSYLISFQGHTWEQAREALADTDVYAMELKALAEHFAEEAIYLPGVNEQILPYLDYDLIARDLSMDYAEINCLGVIYCVRAN